MGAGSAPTHSLLDDLEARGLLYQTTGREALAAHLGERRVVYAGFDPTRPSLTIGNLVPILLLRRFQLAGHQPVVLMGGGTGLIGDPGGKDAERPLQTEEAVLENVRGQRPIFERILDFEGPNAARIVNNISWLGKLGYIEVLRDIGKHFSVNMMIQKESVRARLEEREQGISYTEFSYMILQAYDFAHLAHTEGVTVQAAGSDQWGNITAGIDLTRRLHGRDVFGLTAPLVTKADGTKFGKTEQGAVWLTRDGTSPYAFYQFWINASDEDIGRFLRIYSLSPLSEVEDVIRKHEENPAARLAQQALAEELTRLLHGEEGLAEAKHTTEALFSGDVRSLSESALEGAFGGAPSVRLDPSLLAGEGLPAVELLTLAGVASSKREARQHLSSGAIGVNGDRIDESFRLTSSGLLHGKLALIRRGKKTWHVVTFSSPPEAAPSGQGKSA